TGGFPMSDERQPQPSARPGTGQTTPTPTAVTATPTRVAPPALNQLDFDAMPSGLTDQQKLVLQLLYNHRSLEEAADGACCNRSTIFRWRVQNETFRIAYRLMRMEQRQAGRGNVQTLGDD